MTDLAPILFSDETIAADAAPSLNAAFQQIFDESHIKPVVLAPIGGGRTEAQQAHLVAIGQSNTMLSDHREDAIARGRAAADIYNQHELRAWDEERFLEIMAAHGWHNMTNDGEPFPTEPWHFAKHGITTAGDNSAPISDTTTDEDDMKIITIDHGKPTETSFLIGKQYIHRSPDMETTNQYINLYGSFTHPLDEAAFHRICWSHGISPLVLARVEPGQAWSVERGIFNPGDNIPGGAKP